MKSFLSAIRAAITLLALKAPFVQGQGSFAATNAAQVIDKMKGDVLELAKAVESLYVNRCNQSTLAACANSNYDPCRSRFVDATCPLGIEYTVPECGDGVTCSVLTDFSKSYMWLPNNGEGGDPTNPLVIEGICFSAQLDEWFRKKYTRDKPYWSGYGLAPPPLYFGGSAGYFRSFPAGSNECSDFDARVRPWYTAATSGPKNIVVLLDVSSSMGQENKLDLLKEAAKSVVDKLSVGDRFVLIPFNDTAKTLGSSSGYVNPASDNNKQQLALLIDSLSAGGEMNLMNGFNKAFDVLLDSANRGQAVRCHSAILVMSGGGTNVASGKPSSEENRMLEFIGNRTSELQEVLGGDISIFTYSISSDGKFDPLMQHIACSTEHGVWSMINSTESISDSLESYYMLYALGLGSDENNNFAAWAEPYTFFNLNTVGTTVSVPVYDRTKVPYVFLGVAGMDFFLAALDVALGSQGNSNASVARIVAAATSVCPKLELAPCTVEALRRDTSGEKAVCGKQNCTAPVQCREEKCLNVTYPANIWANLDVKNVPFLNRSCCTVGDKTHKTSMLTCPAAKPKTSSAQAGCGWGMIVVSLWSWYATVALL